MISINFASRNYRLIERIHIGLIAAIVILGMTLLGMIWRATALRMNIVTVEQNLKERQRADERVRPILKEREQLVRDLSAMSGLIAARKFSWTRLLTRLEAVVPLGAALKSVDYNPETWALALEGTAQSPEALRSLVMGLEKSSSFKEPLLKHQSLDKGSISFNVVAVYREDTGVDLASVKK
jgi:Tfp pilus assembly protein PilN